MDLTDIPEEMDLTDIPEEARDGDESSPDLTDVESPDTRFKDGPIRERLLDVITGLRTPTKISNIANLADCGTETARDYLAWSDQMGMVHRQDGRPVRYERNDAYFQWRRIDCIQDKYSNREIVDRLADTLDEIETYSAQFDADDPNDISLIDASQHMSTEDAWEALSEWKTLEQRAALLDAARRDEPVSDSTPSHIDV